ncbi:MAG: hypothetical protein Q9213_000359 [Squamulea squamosa]
MRGFVGQLGRVNRIRKIMEDISGFMVSGSKPLSGYRPMPTDEALSKPPHIYITSLCTYTAHHPHLVIDRPKYGSRTDEYRRFQRHQAALTELSALLLKRRALPEQSPSSLGSSESLWQRSIEKLSEKAGIWVKEMDWVDSAFNMAGDAYHWK